MNDSIKIKSPNYFCLHGEVNFTNAAKIEKLGIALIKKVPNFYKEIIFDLDDVISDGNALLVLLVSWSRFAKWENKSLHFVKSSRQLLNLVKISGLDKFLSFVSLEKSE